jgi:hypothetical protein
MKWQSRIFLFFTGVCLAASLAGCIFSPEDSSEQQVTPAETAFAALESPVVASPTAGQIAAEDPCARRDEELVLPRSAYADYPEIIGAFLNQGGTLQNLDNGLYDAGMLGQPVGIQAGDFDGNNKVDVAVVLINPASGMVTPDGRLLVYLCTEKGFRMHEILPPAEADFRTPILKYNQDLNADLLPELVAAFSTCGAHTCFEALGIYSWQSDHFANRLDSSTADLPFPNVTVEGPDENGFFAIRISASGFGSTGAGPQREIKRVYTYDPAKQNWTQFAEMLGSTNYRIHLLQDAEDLAAEDKFPEALVLYQQVISSDALLDWQDPVAERAHLAAYARYKIVVLYTLLGREEIAQAAVAEFEAAVPENSDQAGFLEMASIFRRQGGAADPGRACAAVQKYAAENQEQLLAPLGSSGFGYANREFTALDTCPWK